MARSKAEIKAIIAGAKRPERLVPIPLRGDLAAECEQLERRLAELELEKGGPGASLAGNPEARTVAERIQALRAEMTDSIVEFRLRALPKARSRTGAPTFNMVKDAHPPRKDNQVDQQNGVHMDEFNLDLLRHSIVDPVLDDEDWENLLEGLSDGSFNVLMGHCYGVNQNDVDVPFSFAASRILQDSDPG